MKADDQIINTKLKLINVIVLNKFHKKKAIWEKDGKKSSFSLLNITKSIGLN